MVTNEKISNKQSKSNLNTENQEINSNGKNNIKSKKWKYIRLSIITIVTVLVIVTIYFLCLCNMSIYNPYETKTINISSEQKDWYINEDIDLFKYKNEDGQKMIWPGQSGEYEFIVQNTNNVPVFYNISLYEDNRYSINMKYRLKINNVYVIGNEKNYVDINKIKLEDIKILEKSKCLYTLEWKWEISNNDTEIVKNGLATYKMYIDIYSKSVGKTL